MQSDFESVFTTLRAILTKHADGLTVTEDAPHRYCLEGHVGPATLRAWRGKVKRPLIPVAWVEVGTSAVSYHLMAIYGNPKALDGMSKQLRARMSGKSCFNFKTIDQASLANELEQLTAQALAAFRRAGFISP